MLDHPLTVWPTQGRAVQAVMAEDRQDVMMFAGAGGGKTWILGALATFLAGFNPRNVAGLVVTPSYPMARDIVRPTFEQFWDDYGVPYEWRASDFAYYLPESDTPILLRPGDDPYKIRGLTVGWGLHDEAAIQPKLTWQVMMQRIRDPRATHRRYAGATTPIGFNWTHEQFVDKPGKYRTHFQWGTKENLALMREDPDFIDRMASLMSPELFAQEMEAQFLVVGQGRTYYSFKRQLHLRAFEMEPHLPLGLCVDFNVAPSVWVVAQGRGTPEQPERAIDEISVTGDRSTIAALREFKARYPQFSKGEGVEVYGDASGQARKTTGYSDFEEIRRALPRARVCVRHKNPYVKDRVNAVNGLLLDARNRVRAYVHPEKCPRLVRDLEQVRNKEGTFEIDKGNPELTHASDAWGYRIHWVHPVLHRVSGTQGARVRAY